MSLRFLRCLLVAFSLCALFTSPVFAHADSYTVYNLGIDHARFVNADDAGNYTTLLYNFGPCNSPAYDCYDTYSAYSNTHTYTTFTPRLQDDPSPVAGAGCTMSLVNFTNVNVNTCNNGHQMISGYYNGRFGIYTGNGSDIQLLFTAISAGHFILTANGNFFFDDGVQDNLMMAIDNTTRLAAQPISFATPEPSSFVLLATGTLGLIGAARRRLFA